MIDDLTKIEIENECIKIRIEDDLMKTENFISTGGPHLKVERPDLRIEDSYLRIGTTYLIIGTVYLIIGIVYLIIEGV